MAAKEQQRQKKLAKKRSKELARKKSQAREKNRMQSFAGQFEAGLTGPIERCLAAEGLFDSPSKFGSVLVSRRMPDGRLCVVRFLIDGLCLGVKNANAFFCFPSQLNSTIESGPENMVAVAPPAAKKMIEQAIAFAAKFELQPAPYYAKVSAVFDDIDSSECETDFEFGRDGQPVFVTGPYDTDQRIGEITDKLQRTAGQDNYVVEYDEGYGLEDEMDGTSWSDDPELDADINEDVVG
ncbi:MAG: hypothetical protein WBD31_08945 [Rubripirellula sp.]